MLAARTVLVGSPVLDVGATIAGWVRRWGYEAQVLRDGGDAVQALRFGRYAASFLDVRLLDTSAQVAEREPVWRVVRPVVGRRLILMARECSNELWFEALKAGVGTVLPLPPGERMVQAALAAVSDR